MKRASADAALAVLTAILVVLVARRTDAVETARAVLAEAWSDPWSLVAVSRLLGAYVLALAAHAAWRVACFFFAPSHLMDIVIDPVTRTNSRLGRDKLQGQPPPPYPNSWFRVLDSCDLAANQVCCVSRLGRELVVVRTSSNAVFVLDRVGVSGVDFALARVAGPTALAVPTSGLPRQQASSDSTGDMLVDLKSGADAAGTRVARLWPCLEANYEIYFYHHAEGLEPSWRPLSPSELTSEFTWHGRSEHVITCHIAEIPENGADVAHLGALHEPSLFPHDKLTCMKWTADWHRSEKPEERHLAFVDITQNFALLGGRFACECTKVHVEVTQQGMGIVFILMRLPLFGRVLAIETVTPVGPSMQLYHHTVSAESSVPRFVAKLVLRALVAQAERDVSIWNYKAYLNRPLLVKGDGPIVQFRRWIKQFFSEPPRRAEEAEGGAGEACEAE